MEVSESRETQDVTLPNPAVLAALRQASSKVSTWLRLVAVLPPTSLLMYSVKPVPLEPLVPPVGQVPLNPDAAFTGMGFKDNRTARKASKFRASGIDEGRESMIV
jgi:hypothetical protein